MLMIRVLNKVFNMDFCLLKSDIFLIIMVVMDLILVSWLVVGEIELMWLIMV